MTGKEILVILFGLFLGYWIVSRLFGSQGRSSTASGAPAAADPAPPVATDVAAPWHEVLHLSPQATATEIHLASEALLAQYRPESVAHLGEELRAVAARRTREIETAVEQAMRELASR